jgi:hypothetical protein
MEGFHQASNVMWGAHGEFYARALALISMFGVIILSITQLADRIDQLFLDITALVFLVLIYLLEVHFRAMNRRLLVRQRLVLTKSVMRPYATYGELHSPGLPFARPRDRRYRGRYFRMRMKYMRSAMWPGGLGLLLYALIFAMLGIHFVYTILRMILG